MDFRENTQPNWLLRGFIAASIGIHLLFLVKMAASFKPATNNYIEIEISGVKKPEVRSIPLPTRPRRAAPETEQMAAPVSAEPVAAPSVTEPMASDPEMPETVAPELLSWIPEPSPEVKDTAAAAGSGSASDDANERYYQEVLRKIEEKRKYPYAARKLRVEGDARIRFVIEFDGAARDVEIAKGSGNRLLDKAALAAVADASPFPKPPADVFSDAVSLEVGVVFRLNNK